MALVPNFTVRGLDQNHYYINNPIWVDIYDLVSDIKYVNVRLEEIAVEATDDQTTAQPTQQKLYVLNRKTYFDIAPIIKGFMKRPNHPENFVNDAPIRTNYITMRITIQSVKEDGTIQTTKTFAKTFLRGGEDTIATNVRIAVGSVLKESLKIPRWDAYPLTKYYINTAGLIAATRFITQEETDYRRVVGSDPIYIRFLNTKGGYSFWLFENWTVEKGSKEGDSIETREGTYDTGPKAVTYKLSVNSRVDREYYHTMQALSESSEVHVYGLNSLNLTSGTFSTDVRYTWVRAKNTGNSVKIINFKDVDNFSFNFEPLFNNKPSIKW